MTKDLGTEGDGNTGDFGKGGNASSERRPIVSFWDRLFGRKEGPGVICSRCSRPSLVKMQGGRQWCSWCNDWAPSGSGATAKRKRKQHPHLEWIREAQSSVAEAESVRQIREALSLALTRFESTGLQMPVGLLAQLNGKASAASEAELGSIKIEMGKNLDNMYDVHTAMLRMAGEM